MLSKSFKVIVKYALSALCAFALVLSVGSGQKIYAASKYESKKQTEYGILGKTRSDLLKVVKNEKFFVPRYKYQYSEEFRSTNTYEKKLNKVNTSKGNYRKMSFVTSAFLPVTFKESGDWGNIQSFIMDENYWYILHLENDHSDTGWIVRYDLDALNNHNIDVHSAKGVDKLRKLGIVNKYVQIKGNLPDEAANVFGGETRAPSEVKTIIQDAIKVGPKFKTGHGQGFAKNPKTGEFWLVQDTKATRKPDVYTKFYRIDPETLKPNAEISFRMGSTIPRGCNLAFDKNGYAYWYNFANPTFNNYKVSWMNKGSKDDKGYVKFFKGTISTKKVNFKMVMQGLQFRPGTIGQSLSYNPVNNRLYVVSDGSITSVPVSKLGKLKPKDVLTTNFKTKREFETVQFDKKGYAYLMVTLGPEILRSTTAQTNK
jgi:hypothetical protein